MALRGPQPAEFRTHQKVVWRTYLRFKVLRYWANPKNGTKGIFEAVAYAIGLPFARVQDLLGSTSPVGCFRKDEP